MTRTNTRLSGEILKLAKNVQDLATAFNGNVHSILRQQRDDREQLHKFYGNMEKALAGLLTRLDAVEARGPQYPVLGVDLAREAKAVPEPRFYVDEFDKWGGCNFYIRDRVRCRSRSFSVLGGNDAVLAEVFSKDTSEGAARAAAKEYCAWLNDMETKKS